MMKKLPGVTFGILRLPATVLVPHSDWNSMMSGELHPTVRYCLPGGLHGVGFSWLFSLPGLMAANALPTSSAFKPPLISYRPRNGQSRPLGEGAEKKKERRHEQTVLFLVKISSVVMQVLGNFCFEMSRHV